jgi:hypothetical protein
MGGSMTVLWSRALARADLRTLGNNLEDAIHDRTRHRRRHYRRLLKAVNQYLAKLRRDECLESKCGNRIRT